MSANGLNGLARNFRDFTRSVSIQALSGAMPLIIVAAATTLRRCLARAYSSGQAHFLFIIQSVCETLKRRADRADFLRQSIYALALGYDLSQRGKGGLGRAPGDEGP